MVHILPVKRQAELKVVIRIVSVELEVEWWMG